MFKIGCHDYDFFDSLRTVELFQNCSDKELARVMHLATVLDVQPGRTLTRQGEAGRECFVITHGATRVERNGINLPTQSAVVGELALMDHVPRTATVTTTTEARVLVMSQREFSGLRHLNISSITRGLEAAADAHRAALERFAADN